MTDPNWYLIWFKLKVCKLIALQNLWLNLKPVSGFHRAVYKH
jgi:hypothetical protein